MAAANGFRTGRTALCQCHVLDSDFAVAKVIDAMMEYVLAHTNKSTSGPGAGWIGPFENEPGDSNGHGLWDPLNMLRTLLN